VVPSVPQVMVMVSPDSGGCPSNDMPGRVYDLVTVVLDGTRGSPDIVTSGTACCVSVTVAVALAVVDVKFCC
jgi:hypothetical protein